MTTYSWPSSIIPNLVETRIISNSKAFVSPLTGYMQTASRAGERWAQSLSISDLKGSDRTALLSFLAKLHGQVHRIESKDHSYAGVQGALGATIEIDGANQTGTSLDVTVSTGSSAVVGFLLAGDQISFSNGTNKELKLVTEDVDLVAGDATIPIWPGIHTSPANGASVEVSNPVGTFILMSNPMQWNSRPGIFSDFNIELLEDIT